VYLSLLVGRALALEIIVGSEDYDADTVVCRITVFIIFLTSYIALFGRMDIV
jgi:hypothetical protein